jgi:hypothetical protein
MPVSLVRSCPLWHAGCVPSGKPMTRKTSYATLDRSFGRCQPDRCHPDAATLPTQTGLVWRVRSTCTGLRLSHSTPPVTRRRGGGAISSQVTALRQPGTSYASWPLLPSDGSPGCGVHAPGGHSVPPSRARLRCGLRQRPDAPLLARESRTGAAPRGSEPPGKCTIACLSLSLWHAVCFLDWKRKERRCGDHATSCHPASARSFRKARRSRQAG